MSNKSTLENNFQHYIDAVKQKEMTWKIFQDLVEDFSHSDVYRLKLVNAMLLMELTLNYSDLDRLKYFNIILMTEFKNFIQRKVEQIQGLENSSLDQDMNHTLIKKMSTNSTNNQIPHIRIEEVEKFDQEIDDFEIKNIEDDQNFGIDDEPRSEISTDNETQISLIGEEHEKDDFGPPIKNSHIQHLLDDEKLIYDKTIDEHDNEGEIITCNICEKTFQTQRNLNRHIKDVHEGHNDYKCETCGKSFTRAGYLKKHIHIIHKGHKDCKCNSCGKSFSFAQNLKLHIQTVHESYRDHKSCDNHFLVQML